ncbi:hypothetical protein [Aquibacillus kalidii]|uniref:hypothetical protein n=1 Tax=Aquibacillus kalidii TaxID=2762597 RepID=UPI001C9908B6|nr:hypothetical protein [Aquibacillus kalidii]
MIVISLLLIKLSIEFYLVYFVLCFDQNVPIMVTIGMVSLMVGFMYLIISTVRGVTRFKHGEFKEGRSGLYNFKQSKGFVSIPIIFGVTILGGVIARGVSNMSEVPNIVELIIPLVISFFLQCGIAMIIPEFFLITYCKFRYQSFNVVPK